jgi:formylglycine-generating enzyme required for sulfatase activity
MKKSDSLKFTVCIVFLSILLILFLSILLLNCRNVSQIENLVLVEGGTFQMGDQFDEGKSYERPVHQIKLSDFYMAKYEVTVKNFRTFVNETGYKTSAEGEPNEKEQKKYFNMLTELQNSSDGNIADYNHFIKKALSFSGSFCFEKSLSSWTFEADMNWQNPHYNQTEMDPVTCMSWDDAIHYCNWLSQREGLPASYNEETGDLIDEHGHVTNDITKVKGYRLPTEAEWEYAAREKGKKVRFGNGKNIARSEEINFNASEAKYAFVEKGKYRKKLIPVGSFPPNSLGLYDMSGNVWEWCSDYVTIYKNEKQINPYKIGDSFGVMRRASRGGRWAGDADELRVSTRFGWESFNRCNNTGFRIARSK